MVFFENLDRLPLQLGINVRICEIVERCSGDKDRDEMVERL